MAREIPWICRTCGYKAYHWSSHLVWRMFAGVRRQTYSNAESVMWHQNETGHTTWDKKVGPAV